jgi:uncharacterized protein
VTNVTSFGAFVDIGVHQDGLVHISAMSEKFIKDPRDAAKAGDIVKVKVMAIDIPRQRIGLSMRLTDSTEAQPQPRTSDPQHRTKPSENVPRKTSAKSASPQKKSDKPDGAFAAAFAKAKKRD